jgi:hypothetical protein
MSTFRHVACMVPFKLRDPQYARRRLCAAATRTTVHRVHPATRGIAPRPRCCIVSSSSTIRISGGGRRMAETAALLADGVLPERPLRQWVLSLPFALRFLLATDPDSLTLVLRTVHRAISAFLPQKAGLTRATGHPGAVTLIQRFGSALNLNIHFHMIFLDGLYLPVGGAAPVFRHVPAPTGAGLRELVQQIAVRIGKVLEQRGIVERCGQSSCISSQIAPIPHNSYLTESTAQALIGV